MLNNKMRLNIFLCVAFLIFMLCESKNTYKICSDEIQITCETNSDCGFSGGHCVFDCNKNGINDEIDINDGILSDFDKDGQPDECEEETLLCSRPMKYWKSHTPLWPYKYNKMPYLCGIYWNKILSYENIESAWYILARQWISSNLNKDYQIDILTSNETTSQFFGDALACFDETMLLLNDFCFEKLNPDTEYTEERKKALSCAEILAEFNEGILYSDPCTHHTITFNQEDLQETADGLYDMLLQLEIPPRAESKILIERNVENISLTTTEIVVFITIAVIIGGLFFGFVVKVIRSKRNSRPAGYVDLASMTTSEQQQQQQHIQ